jgi:hypothetical protein
LICNYALSKVLDICPKQGRMNIVDYGSSRSSEDAWHFGSMKLDTWK